MNSANSSVQPKKTFPAEVYLNGEWLTHDKAFISVFDRGFMLGDGIYEVVPFYTGKFFYKQEHLQRMKYCLSQIELDFDIDSLEELIAQAVSRSGLSEKDGAVYLQISRGVAPRTHFYPENIPPTILLYAYEVKLEGFEKKEASVLVSTDRRWHRCDIKSTSLMANVRSNNMAHSRGLDENVLVRDGLFTEGSHSTAFFVKQGKLYTHPKGPHILPGITRQVVIDLCRELKIEVVEEAVHIDELVEVDEVFLTGTTTQILLIKSMVTEEEEIYKCSKMGPVTHKLQQAFIKITRGLS